MTAAPNELPRTGAAPDPYRVHELPTDRIRFCPTNPPQRVEDVGDLVSSIGQVRQQVPGIGYPDPDRPGCFIAADGNRRLMACRILGLPFLVMLLDHKPTKSELRRIRLTVNNVHNHLTPDQVADEIWDHIREEKCSQEEASDFFALSPGYVSKLLAPFKRLLPELRDLAGKPGVSRDVLRLVASMPTPEMQKQLAERVLASVDREGKAKRSAIELARAEIVGGKKVKDHPLVLKHDGIVFTAKKPTADGLRAFAEKLLAAAKKLKPGDDIGDLPFYFRAT